MRVAKIFSGDIDNDGNGDLIFSSGSFATDKPQLFMIEHEEQTVVVSTDDNGSSITPSKLSLSQNYPNPFNPITSFHYNLAEYGKVKITITDILGREKILKVHSKKITMASDINLRTVARGTPGFSGADLANLVNESALLAARKNKRLVTNQEFEEAKDKVMMGAERRSMVMTEDEKKLTAYHEGGHAIVSFNLKNSDPIHKATIIPRGRALGMVMRLPERDQLSVTREKMYSDIAVAMGGRIAEELIFGYEKITSGASSDIDMATKMAKNMVTRYGMSKDLGTVAYGENEEEVFLGRSIARQQNMSEEMTRKVDIEVRKLIDEGYNKATKILTEKLDDLHKIAKACLLYTSDAADE